MQPQPTTITSIPTELLYDIIERVWTSPLPPDQRIQAMCSFKLVSKTCAAIFNDLSLTDVHIPCKSFYYHLFNDGSRDFSSYQRITFTISSQNGLGSSWLSPSNLQCMTGFDMEKLTSLRTMNIVYYEMIFPDPYDEDFLLALPRYLPRLTISYTFSSDKSPLLIDDYRRQFQHHSTKPRYANPRVGVLEINGASEFIAAIWESLFPERGRLMRDGKEEKQRMIPVSSRYDPIYGIPFLLKNWQREQEFISANSFTARFDELCASPLILSKEDGWAFPLSPEVTRSPTETSVASTSTGQNRQRKKGSREDPVEFKQIDGSGVRLLVTNYLSVEPDFPEFSQQCVPLGEVGYINKETGTFSRLFNAFEPHYVQGFTIPSLRGYGEVQVHSMKHKGDQQHDGAVQGHGSYANINFAFDPESHDGKAREDKMGGMARARKAMGSMLKIAGGSGGKWFRTKEAEFRYIESEKGKGVAETWFEANLDKVVALYGLLSGVSRDNLVFVTGTTTA
ncbi:hypothetical protein AX15_002211 [Amanita polypyramis BW_CC]|nr:hypothetical protein AX15_002211 [Amanita polypyramis BW_CC]